MCISEVTRINWAMEGTSGEWWFD